MKHPPVGSGAEANTVELSLDSPWPRHRIVYAEEGVLVVDKPSGVPVHGGDPKLAHDVVSRLKAKLAKLGGSGYLGVHQRLDQDTSGVLLFTTSKAKNPEVARSFEGRLAHKVYWAVVSSPAGPACFERLSGVWKDRLGPLKEGRVEVLPRGGELAETHCRVREVRGSRALLELHPVTGRTHQLRVQAEARGVPVVGDRLYGGERAVRLMLHAKQLELPKIGRFSALVPGVFFQALEGAAFDWDPSEVRRRLADALFKRVPLSQVTNALRLVNDWPDQLEYIAVDRFGAAAVVQCFHAQALAAAELISGCLKQAGLSRVYLEVGDRSRAKTKPLRSADSADAGETEERPQPPEVVLEHGMQFQIRFEGTSRGLFLDQRANRLLVREWSREATVANLFCHTGSFSVAAALGGAKLVTSVDTSGNYLEWAKHHFLMNGLDSTKHEFVREDALRWLARALKQRRFFDLVVLDPPSFSSAGKNRGFTIARNMPEAILAATRVISRKGRLLVVTNHRKTSLKKLRFMVRQAAEAANRKLVELRDLGSGLDFPDAWDEPLPSKSLVARFD